MYFSDKWNYVDQFHIWGGIFNVLLHSIDYDSDWFAQVKKMLLITLCFFMLVKTFFFMRLFKSMAHLVMMMLQVIVDLKAFLFFYLVLIWICGLVLDILGLGEDTSDILSLKAKRLSYPGIEYQHLPKFLRQFFHSIRISLGDFEFGDTVSLGVFEHNIFWLTWLISVLMTCIVFLNFIIAEVSASYDSVNKRVRGLIDKERAQLIREAEDMLLTSWKQNKDMFPKYLIRREVES